MCCHGWGSLGHSHKPLIHLALYMDPPGMSRYDEVTEDQRQMHTYIRLLAKAWLAFEP